LASVSTKLSPDLLMQPLRVVWSAEEVPVEVALEPLCWSLGELEEGAAPWSEPGAAPVELPLDDPAPVDPVLDPPACANVIPAVISRMLVK
jgi:hypothetical protein